MRRRNILKLILVSPFLKLTNLISAFYKKKKYKKYTWVLKSDD